MQLNFYTAVFVLSCSTLLSCGTPSSEDSLSPPTSHRKLVSEVQFEDDVLARCVKRRTSAVYVDELRSLTCNTYIKGFTIDQRYEQAVTSTKGIEELTALEHLDLSRGWLGEINISTLSKLRHLNLSNNIIQTLDLSQNSALEVLNLSMNPLYEVVLPLTSNLHKMDINKGKPSFGTLNRLTNLREDPSDPPLSSEFFDVVSGLRLNTDSYTRTPIIDYSTQTKLEVFSATNRKFDIASLKSLPEQNNIKALDLSENTISVLKLPPLPKLETLNASRNRIEEVILLEQSNIKALDLSQNAISVLNLPALPKLETLDVSYNKIREVTLPEQNSINALDLSRNTISVLKLPELPKLQKLNLDNNLLDASTAEAINTLESVETVSLYGNANVKWIGTPDSPIKHLTLSGNQDAYEFEVMDNLESLSLSDATLNGSSLNTTTLNIKSIKFNAVSIIGKLALNCTGVDHLILDGIDLESMDLSACKTKKISISPPASMKGALDLPESVTSLSIYKSGIETLKLTNASHLKNLDISYMPKLTEIDFTPLFGLTDLRIYWCEGLRHLDISPLADMDGRLSLDYLLNLSSLKAIGLQNLSGAYLGFLPSIDQVDRFNIEQLTNTKTR